MQEVLMILLVVIFFVCIIIAMKYAGRFMNKHYKGKYNQLDDENKYFKK